MKTNLLRSHVQPVRVQIILRKNCMQLEISGWIGCFTEMPEHISYHIKDVRKEKSTDDTKRSVIGCQSSQNTENDGEICSC